MCESLLRYMEGQFIAGTSVQQEGYICATKIEKEKAKTQAKSWHEWQESQAISPRRS
jgi:hypothetical protein